LFVYSNFSRGAQRKQEGGEHLLLEHIGWPVDESLQLQETLPIARCMCSKHSGWRGERPGEGNGAVRGGRTTSYSSETHTHAENKTSESSPRSVCLVRKSRSQLVLGEMLNISV